MIGTEDGTQMEGHEDRAGMTSDPIKKCYSPAFVEVSVKTLHILTLIWPWELE